MMYLMGAKILEDINSCVLPAIQLSYVHPGHPVPDESSVIIHKNTI